MKKQINTFAVQINKEETGYSAVVLGIKDCCATEAKTYDELLINVKEMLELYVEGLRELNVDKGLTDLQEEHLSPVIMMPVYA